MLVAMIDTNINTIHEDEVEIVFTYEEAAVAKKGERYFAVCRDEDLCAADEYVKIGNSFKPGPKTDLNQMYKNILGLN